jgi:uncharacterized protein YciI
MIGVSLAAIASSPLYLVLLVRPDPAPPALPADQATQVQSGHMAHLTGLYHAGHSLVAGPFENGGRLRGIVVVRAADALAAKRLMDPDPAVAAGRLAAEAYPWHVRPQLFGKPGTKMQPYHFLAFGPGDLNEVARVLATSRDPSLTVQLFGRAADSGPYQAFAVLSGGRPGSIDRLAESLNRSAPTTVLRWWCAQGVVEGTKG